MSLVRHAREELIRAGLLTEEGDVWLAKKVLDLMECFAGQGHSGHTAAVTLDLFMKLARFETLTPIDGNSDDWIDRSRESGRPFWQNRRDSRCFSEDGGKTWTRIGE